MSVAGIGSSHQSYAHPTKGAGSLRQTVSAGLNWCMVDDAFWIDGLDRPNVPALAKTRSIPSQTESCFPKRMHTKKI